jgi:hypothetical protein
LFTEPIVEAKSSVCRGNVRPRKNSVQRPVREIHQRLICTDLAIHDFRDQWGTIYIGHCSCLWRVSIQFHLENRRAEARRVVCLG